MKLSKLLYLLTVLSITLISCSKVSIPENATAITDFEVEKYLGTWHEIARLDHSFEENLNQVTATYSLNEDGTVKVINKGFNSKKGKWEEAEGKAKFVGDKNVGRLKVSFFGPFYGGYNIVALDDDYENSLVVGNDLNNLWFLSRTKELNKTKKQEFLDIAEQIGYATDQLIWVDQH